VELAVERITPELERELRRRTPWMHPFRLGEEALLGTFKYHGLADTVFLNSSPPDSLARAREAYADIVSGRPFAHLDVALDRLGAEPGATYLDIACATGLYSFHLSDIGGDVRGVEIRPEQVEQARLLQGLDQRFATAPLRFDHVPTSADDPAFLEGEHYDVVLSLGLLYHLGDPLQHLRNVRRLAQRGAIIYTLTNVYGKPGLWSHIAEDPNIFTKATSGLSWMPYYRDLPRLMLEAGFARAEHVRHPLMGKLQPPIEQSVLTRIGALLTPPALTAVASRLVARFQHEQRASALRRGLNPGYYTIVAWI
jgi:SAM-dependent methyltransferase